MAEVEIGVKVRGAFPWLQDMAEPDIEVLQKEVQEQYRHPEVKKKDAALIGKAYREAENKLAAAETHRNEVRHEMLNHWCQHNVTDFPAGLSAPYRVVPRIKLSLDSDEVRELVGEKAWEAVTVPVREVDPSLLLAYVQSQGPPMQQRLTAILYGDCTPELKPPRETPKNHDKRVLGRTPKRKKKKAA